MDWSNATVSYGGDCSICRHHRRSLLVHSNGPSSSTNYATFTLSISNNNRADGGAVTEINLPLKANAVRLYLKLPEALDQATRFRAELLKDTGETISVEKVARVEQAAVIELPAAQLSRGEYALKLFVVKSDGTEERINGSYFLSVK